VIRRQFSAQEIRAIFDYRPDHVLEAREYPEASYWLPKLMALMLMRPSEIADLKLRDIRRQSGITYLSLVEVDTKNHSSKRRVPVHKKLIELGFLDYVERCGRIGNVYLFEELQSVDKQDPLYSKATPISKWFNRTLMQKLSISKADTQKHRQLIDMYCLRKTGICYLISCGVPLDIIQRLVGHSLKKSMIEKHYGQGVSPSLRVLLKAINKIDYFSDGWDASFESDIDEEFFT
jgi:integrase